jgi:hypothetical protein
LPFVAVAVMTLVPGATAVTTPALTVATEVVALVHVRVLSVASSGSTDAVSVSDAPPTIIVALPEGAVTVTDVTATSLSSSSQDNVAIPKIAVKKENLKNLYMLLKFN